MNGLANLNLHNSLDISLIKLLLVFIEMSPCLHKHLNIHILFKLNLIEYFKYTSCVQLYDGLFALLGTRLLSSLLLSLLCTVLNTYPIYTLYS